MNDHLYLEYHEGKEVRFVTGRDARPPSVVTSVVIEVRGNQLDELVGRLERAGFTVPFSNHATRLGIYLASSILRKHDGGAFVRVGME